MDPVRFLAATLLLSAVMVSYVNSTAVEKRAVVIATTEPYQCTCQIRCCVHVLQKRSDASAMLNLPFIRHKRCCGCVDCTETAASK